jgi:hypothetical protein
MLQQRTIVRRYYLLYIPLINIVFLLFKQEGYTLFIFIPFMNSQQMKLFS